MLRFCPSPRDVCSSTAVPSFAKGAAAADSDLIFDDVRDGMLRNDLFFFGTSDEFGSVRTDASWDAAADSALAGD